MEKLVFKMSYRAQPGQSSPFPWWKKKCNAMKVCSKKIILNEINKGSVPFPLLFQLTFCLSLSSCFLVLSFISSKTEDWGYLNEDGELGLAYQGLKQVARSNTFCFSPALLVPSPPFALPSCFSLALLLPCGPGQGSLSCLGAAGGGFPHRRDWDPPGICRGAMVPAACCWWWLLSLMPELWSSKDYVTAMTSWVMKGLGSWDL